MTIRSRLGANLYEHFAISYNDGLQIVDIYDAIEDYACAYVVYMIETSLIIANYSIRTDQIKRDHGNFPLWDMDFFKRDPRLMASFSRHAHIIDYDMLRLGKLMVEKNPNRNAFGYGIYVISEIDKERKNALQLRETKQSAAECNQRNDLFEAMLKMARHACVIRNRVFVKVFADLQRPEDYGASGREIGKLVCIDRKGDMMPAFPLMSPFWTLEGLFYGVRSFFVGFYLKFIYRRADNALPVFISKNVSAYFEKCIKRTNNIYGCQTLHLEIEDGRMDRPPVKAVWYRMPKKDYARRYATDCLSAIFDGDEVNTVSIADFAEYADIMATADERAKQHSHFENEISRLKKKLRQKYPNTLRKYEEA